MSREISGGGEKILKFVRIHFGRRDFVVDYCSNAIDDSHPNHDATVKVLPLGKSTRSNEPTPSSNQSNRQNSIGRPSRRRRQDWNERSLGFRTVISVLNRP